MGFLDWTIVLGYLGLTLGVGLNVLTWDLRYDGPRQVELRTTPPDNPHIWEEARFLGKQTRPIIHLLHSRC